jgi:hypothetical protein
MRCSRFGLVCPLEIPMLIAIKSETIDPGLEQMPCATVA